jgi:hypothetical protein
MLSQAGGNHNYKIIPSSSKANMKWQNIVLDLNGILCVCQEKRLMAHDQAYVDGSRSHSGTVPYFVGPKAIFVCPF